MKYSFSLRYIFPKWAQIPQTAREPITAINCDQDHWSTHRASRKPAWNCCVTSCTQFTHFPYLSFLPPWPQLAAFAKQEGRWEQAIVGKCSFLSGMTQAAAVISSAIVGHQQRASITPARPWHRQQVPPLPARLALMRLWKPSDIQKGTDLHWMHHWLNTADYQLTYSVLYRTEKKGKMASETQKGCLKILAVCCYNHVLNTDLTLFRWAFTSRCGFVSGR